MSESTSATTNQPSDEPQGVDLGRVFGGLAFVTIGAMVWLRFDDGISWVDLATYWPLVFVILGVSSMLSERSCSDGFFFTALGLGLLFFNLGYAPWPVLLVGGGLVLVVRGLREGSRLAKTGGGDG